jgi:purine-binding chemotaxis protein CheW
LPIPDYRLSKDAQMKQTTKALKNTRAAVDWEAVRRQIDEASQKLANSEEISPAALEQAWARRSAQIAQKIQEEQQGEVVKAAIISLDNELYGLDVQYIFDIRVLEHITFVPRVPAWVLGVVNWRGRILSVIDLRRFLGLSSNNASQDKVTPALAGGARETAQRLVVLQAGEMEVGIQADEVFLIESIPVSKINTNDGMARAIKPEFVSGLFMRAGEKTQNQQGIVVLLNLPALLADPHLVIHEEIL